MSTFPQFPPDCDFPAAASAWDVPAVAAGECDVWSAADAFQFGNGLLDIPWPEIDGGGGSDFSSSFLDRFCPSAAGAAEAVAKLEGGLGCAAPPGFVEKCSAFVPDVCGSYAAANAPDDWDFHGRTLPKNGELSPAKATRYSEEERRGRILRYLQKRNQRNFNKTIKYACRKTLADRRRRVRGRFASNSEIHRVDQEEHHDDGAKVEGNGEDWYEQAMCIYRYLLLD